MRRVRAWIALRAPAPHLIDEVAQEAFVVAFQKIDSFAAGTSFIAWVRAIAWQLLRREIQRFSVDLANREKLAGHIGVLNSDTGNPQPISEGQVEHLEHCLGKVTGEGRDLLHLKYRDGYSTKEIAGKLERSGDWVRTRLYRIRNQLRTCIEKRMQTLPS